MHPRKALPTIKCTEFGISIEVSEEQLANVSVCIDKRERERITDSRLEQPENAEEPIEVTLSGIIIEVR